MTGPPGGRNGGSRGRVGGRGVHDSPAGRGRMLTRRLSPRAARWADASRPRCRRAVARGRRRLRRGRRRAARGADRALGVRGGADLRGGRRGRRRGDGERAARGRGLRGGRGRVMALVLDRSPPSAGCPGSTPRWASSSAAVAVGVGAGAPRRRGRRGRRPGAEPLAAGRSCCALAGSWRSAGGRGARRRRARRRGWLRTRRRAGPRVQPHRARRDPRVRHGRAHAADVGQFRRSTTSRSPSRWSPCWPGWRVPGSP